MKNQVQESTVSKSSMVKNAISLLPMVKKTTSLLLTAKEMLNSRIKSGLNQIKGIMGKIEPNRFKKGRNTSKKVSNRRIKYLENKFHVKATKNIIHTPKIVIEKPQIVAKPRVVTSSKITSKVKKVVIEKKIPQL